MMTRTLAPLVSVLAAVALAPACTVFWKNLTILERRDQAELTVHGKLVAKEMGTACGQSVRLLHFEVRKAFGKPAGPGDTVVIATPPNDAACGVDYPLGTEVVVFANRSPWYCATPIDMPFTSHANWNLRAPTDSQVDSLHGGPASLAYPVNKAGRTSAAGITMGFAAPGKGTCRADGRSLAP